MSMRRAVSLGLAYVLFAAVPAISQDAATAVTVSGQVQHPVTVSLADLQKLPPTSVAISFETDRGPESATYTGALLWSVLANSGLVDAPGKNTGIRHTFLVIGRDGYAAALSDGEIDPRLEGKSALLAYQKDGKPNADGIRLVVPGDHHGARAVRDVVKIEVQ